MTDLDPDGAAAQKGLRPGDVILDAARQAGRWTEDVVKAWSREKGRPPRRAAAGEDPATTRISSRSPPIRS